MIFEQVRSGGCLSYVVGCEDTRAGFVVDPALDHLDHYLALATERGLRLHYVFETHTHADHFSAARELAQRIRGKLVMNERSAAPHVDLRLGDGETVLVGKLRVRALSTPGHTDDSMCLVIGDRVLTGDTLLIGGTGRTDLPTGDPAALHASLFDKLLALPGETRVFPAHDYKGRSSTTIAAELATNPRLQRRARADFVALMQSLDLAMPDHLTEALRTNRTGAKSVTQLIGEAAREIAFLSMDEVRRRLGTDLVLLDVRERADYDAGHLPGARHLPRGQLELRVDKELPDPTARILVYCQVGRISTLATATLRSMGYLRAVALDGGFAAWRDAGYPVEPTAP